MRNHRREPRSQDFYDEHHIYWPRSWYRGAVEARFRQHHCHRLRLYREEHNFIHRNEEPPKKPPFEFMLEVNRMHDRRECPICHPKEVSDDE